MQHCSCWYVTSCCHRDLWPTLNVCVCVLGSLRELTRLVVQSNQLTSLPWQIGSVWYFVLSQSCVLAGTAMTVPTTVNHDWKLAKTFNAVLNDTSKQKLATLKHRVIIISQWTPVSEPWWVNPCEWTPVSEPLSVNPCRWTPVSEPLWVNPCQWTPVSEPPWVRVLLIVSNACRFLHEILHNC